jgi:nucleotide-binding universal stress UspA family protein
LRAFERRQACDLRLVHLYWPPREHELLGLGPPVAFEDEPEVVEVLSRGLRAHILAEMGRDDLPLRVRPFWDEEANPLAWEAETDDADILVVGTGQGRASMALAAVRGSRVPVLCVPARPRAAAKTTSTLTPIRTVLVTTDFSRLGDAAIPEAYRLIARGGGDVVLGTVVEGAPTIESAEQAEIEARLRALVPPRVDRHAIRTRTFVTGHATAGEAIVKAIRRFNPDVVVMASHGRSGVARSVHGSVTEYVARRSPKPLLVVPAPPD